MTPEEKMCIMPFVHEVARVIDPNHIDVTINFDGELFDRKIEEAFAEMERGELPWPVGEDEFRILVTSILPGCISREPSI